MTFFTRIANKFRRRSFDVAGGSGRWPASASLYAPVSQQLAARATAVRRVQWLAENSPTASAIVGGYVTALCGGDGVTARSAHPDPEIAADLEDRFFDFSASCDIEGISNLGGMLARATRSLVAAGESFVHQVVADDTRLKLRLISPEQVDSNLTRPSLGMTGDAPRVIAGIESDALGRRVAFWILPTQLDLPWASVAPAVRVPALDVVHLYEPRFAGQQRGMPWLSAVATRLQELDVLEDSALKKAQVAALFSAFIRDADGSSGLAAEATGANPATLSMEPGVVRVLPPGTDIVFPNIPDMGTIGEVLRHMMRSCAAGAGVPYELASADYSQTNYSSGRLAAENFKRRVKHVQQTLLCGQFLEPVWRRFVLLEILSGRLRADDFEAAPQNYMRCEFRFSQPEPIDPLKSAKGDVLLLKAGIKSRAELIAERGRDIADVTREIEADDYAPDIGAAATNILSQSDEVSNANA